ncbi:MAG: hypothetical protein AAF555_10200 [Verrucomicrobiota bacterium]
MKTTFFLLGICLLLPLGAIAEPQEWFNADRSQSFIAEWIALEGQEVTLRRSNGATVTLALERFSPTCQSKLKELAASPLPSGSERMARLAAIENSASAGLPSSRRASLAKLLQSFPLGTSQNKILKAANRSTLLMPVDSDVVVFGTTSRDGYQTRVGGQPFHLTFEFAQGLLVEVTLQSPAMEKSLFSTQAKTLCASLREQIATQVGPPSYPAAYPPLRFLQEGHYVSHAVWEKPQKNWGHLFVGVGLENGQVHCLLRHREEPFAMVANAR